MNLVNLKQKFEKITNKRYYLNLYNRLLSKIFAFNLKYSNFLQYLYEFNNKKDYLYSYPSSVSLTTTNLCNYRCTFCEIHYFYKFAKESAGEVFKNNINLDFIKKFEKLFDRIISIELSGASGEPLVNPYFINVIRELKKKKIKTAVTTNGSLLDEKIARLMVKMKFNHVLVSLHSGDEQIYQDLQGGNFNQILKNLERLVQFRKIFKSKLPLISVNCLIFKLNHHTIKNLINKMKEIGVDEININHYYDARNKIKEKVSFYFTPEEGNLILEDLYRHAKSLDFKLTPESPRLIRANNEETICIVNHICESPWRAIKFKGCVEYENSHYVCVCNRIMLFRLNYKEFDGDFHKDIWNHEMIRFIRKNVMSNPICKFCCDKNTPKLRCINNKQYQMTRDKAIRDFFKDVYNKIVIKPRKGIYLIDKFPYEFMEEDNEFYS